MSSDLPSKKTGAPIHAGTIVGIVLAVLLIAAIILAGIYINSHPTSNAALFFIEVSEETLSQPCPAVIRTIRSKGNVSQPLCIFSSC